MNVYPSQSMSGPDPNCVFCKILAGELPGTIVDEDELTVALMDINPATRGHTLVIPRAHTVDLLSIDPDDLAAVARASQRIARRISEQLRVPAVDGVNLVNSCGAVAWQTVFHFHVHVIPRYAEDPLRLPWVPAPGDPAEIATVAQELAGQSRI